MISRLSETQSGLKWSKTAFYVVAAALLVLLPVLVATPYDLGRFRLGLVYVLAALGLNIAFGWAGEFTLGHVAVMAVAAYTSAILGIRTDLPIPLSLLGGVLVGVAIAMILGIPSIRVKGAYLGLLTLFVVLAISPVTTIASGITGGDYGLPGVPLIAVGSFSTGVITYEMAAVSVILTLFLTGNLVRSPWGTRLELLRDAPHAARAVGMNLLSMKTVVYALYAIPAAVAGEIIAYGDSFVTSRTFNLELTLTILTGVILGGRGTLWGPVVGTVPLVLLTFYIGPFSSINPIIFGIVLVIVVIAFPNGVIPAFAGVMKTRRGNSSVSYQTEDPTGLEHFDIAEAVGGGKLNSSAADNPVERDFPASEELLKLVDVKKSFGGVKALDGVSASFNSGRIVGIVGQNGSGKSTLLNLINGFYRSTSGTIEIAGSQTTNWPVHRIARLGVGRTFQVPRLTLRQTVAQNIEAGLLHDDGHHLVASLCALPSIRRRMRSRATRVNEIIDLLGLPREISGVPAGDLSLGLKRVVEVGRAAVSRPALLLLDEPGAGLDDVERNHLANAISSLRDDGVTPVVVEHNIEFVLGLCDVVVLMDSGQVKCVAEMDNMSALPSPLEDYLQFAQVQ